MSARSWARTGSGKSCMKQCLPQGTHPRYAALSWASAIPNRGMRCLSIAVTPRLTQGCRRGTSSHEKYLSKLKEAEQQPDGSLVRCIFRKLTPYLQEAKSVCSQRMPSRSFAWPRHWGVYCQLCSTSEKPRIKSCICIAAVWGVGRHLSPSNSVQVPS